LGMDRIVRAEMSSQVVAERCTRALQATTLDLVDSAAQKAMLALKTEGS
jgi:hypothetical protein